MMVAYGPQARVQARHLARSLVKHQPQLPFKVVTDKPFRFAQGFPIMPIILQPDLDLGARLAKLQVDLLSPWDHTLYLDADTRIRGPIDEPWLLLEAGWDLVMMPCERQGDQIFIHIEDPERQETIKALGTYLAAFQAGVIWFKKGPAIEALFDEWRKEWAIWQAWDQAALMRALVNCQPKPRIWPLHSAYNGGHLVGHYHSRARRAGLKNSVPI